MYPLPPALVLDQLPLVLDQGAIAACAVNACANALSYCMARQGRPNFRASRMFLYYNVRRHVMKSTDLTQDTGCTLRDACKAAVKFGACDETLWPYSRRLLGVKPPDHLYATAKRANACCYQAVPHSLDHMVSCLAQGYPIMMGMTLFGNIRHVRNKGSLDLPGPGDAPLGCHAVLVCGYDLNTRKFRVQNCWGAKWGDHGFFDVGFEYLLDSSLCWDLWVLKQKS